MAAIQPYKQVAVVFTASLLYGLYLSTLLFCFRWLLFSDDGWTLRRRKSINWPVVGVTTSIFILTAVYLAVTLTSVMDAVHIASLVPGGVHQVAWYGIVQCTTANLTALLADSVLMYRCWVVSNRNVWLALFPVLLWLGGLGCTVLQAYLQLMHTSDPLIGPFSWAHVNMSLGPGIVLTPFWGSTAVLNAYCTAMLIYKIYQASKDSGNTASTTEFRFVIRVLAESGILYMSVTIAHFVVWFTTNDILITIVTAFNLPLIGMAFNLILIRTSANRSRSQHSHTQSNTTQSNCYSPPAHKASFVTISPSTITTPPLSPPQFAHNYSINHNNGSTQSTGFISVQPGLRVYDSSGSLARSYTSGGAAPRTQAENDGPGLNMHVPQTSNWSTATGATLV